MGLLQQEINELSHLRKLYNSGKLCAEAVMINVALFSQTEKRAKLMLQAFSLGAKYGKTHMKKIEQSNLLTEGTAIDSEGSIEEAKIKCAFNGKLLTREECLDFSGDVKNQENCRGCDVGMLVKKLLCG